MSFWQKLNKPILVLAPMADVTDPAFRRIIAKYGKPDVMFTEFVSADGLARAPEEGKKKLLKDLEYTEAERPIVAQFFTGKPEYMEQAASLAEELGFDGVDINMGCPDQGVCRQDAGAALIRVPSQARAIIQAAKSGAPNLPVSIKTRLGYSKDELETWLPELLKEEPAAITIHARTKKELSKVPARWKRIKRGVVIRDEMNSETLILGNGDASSLEDARERTEIYKCDGVMLGKAIFGNPWLWSGRAPALPERLNVMIEHTKLFEEILGEYKNFAIMKKHYKAYVSGFLGAVELRGELMQATCGQEVEQLVNNFLANLEKS